MSIGQALYVVVPHRHWRGKVESKPSFETWLVVAIFLFWILLQSSCFVHELELIATSLALNRQLFRSVLLTQMPGQIRRTFAFGLRLPATNNAPLRLISTTAREAEYVVIHLKFYRYRSRLLHGELK